MLAAASTEISHTEQKTVILVRSLYENWAPKGTSAMDYITRRTD